MLQNSKMFAQFTNAPKHYLLWLLSILSAFLLASCQPDPPTDWSGRVVGVASGQTIEVIDPQTQKPQRVRIVGIEAPDLRQQPWGEAAKRRLQQLVGDRQVRLEFVPPKIDRYGRWMAYVWLGTQLVGERLARDGYVLADDRLPRLKYRKRLENAQAWARLMGKGIWDPQKPLRLRPGKFRDRQRANEDGRV